MRTFPSSQAVGARPSGLLPNRKGFNVRRWIEKTEGCQNKSPLSFVRNQLFASCPCSMLSGNPWIAYLLRHTLASRSPFLPTTIPRTRLALCASSTDSLHNINITSSRRDITTPALTKALARSRRHLAINFGQQKKIITSCCSPFQT